MNHRVKSGRLHKLSRCGTSLPLFDDKAPVQLLMVLNRIHMDGIDRSRQLIQWKESELLYFIVIGRQRSGPGGHNESYRKRLNLIAVRIGDTILRISVDTERLRIVNRQPRFLVHFSFKRIEHGFSDIDASMRQSPRPEVRLFLQQQLFAVIEQQRANTGKYDFGMPDHTSELFDVIQHDL